MLEDQPTSVLWEVDSFQHSRTDLVMRTKEFDLCGTYLSSARKNSGRKSNPVDVVDIGCQLDRFGLLTVAVERRGKKIGKLSDAAFVTCGTWIADFDGAG
jgi:hypothetical protein